jgi:hypothetical protein
LFCDAGQLPISYTIIILNNWFSKCTVLLSYDSRC